MTQPDPRARSGTRRRVSCRASAPGIASRVAADAIDWGIVVAIYVGILLAHRALRVLRREREVRRAASRRRA